MDQSCLDFGTWLQENIALQAFGCAIAHGTMVFSSSMAVCCTSNSPIGSLLRDKMLLLCYLTKDSFPSFIPKVEVTSGRPKFDTARKSWTFTWLPVLDTSTLQSQHQEQNWPAATRSLPSPATERPKVPPSRGLASPPTGLELENSQKFWAEPWQFMSYLVT